MSRPLTRFLSAFLAVAMLVGCAVIYGSAATYRTASNAASSSYKSGIYYQNFQRIPLTGDGRTDLLAIALSQTGYQESSSSSSLAGTSGTSGNYTEYNYNMGDFGSGYSYAWCASFVAWSLYQSQNTNQNTMSAWCRNHTGDSAYIWREVSCSQWANQLRRYGYFKYSKQNGGSYTPQSGDLIFFDWAGGSSNEDHIGIVVYSDSSYVYTIEGNTSDAEGLEDNGGGAYFKKYSLGYDYITGYGVLPYKTDASVQKIDYSGANPTPGLYMATSSNKYVYASETASTHSWTLPRFSLFEVTGICSNGMVKATCTINGSTVTGYIKNNSDRIVQLTCSATDGLDDAIAAAKAIYFGDYSEENLVKIRTSYASAVSLSASTTATFAQKKAAADALTSLITSLKGKGTLVGDAVYVTAINKKITAAECNIFTPSFGTITASNANHKWTTNVIAKWNSTLNSYVIKSILPMKGESTTDVAIESDEIFIAVHCDTAANAYSADNHNLITSAKVGDTLTFYGLSIDNKTVSVGAYFTIETPYISGDADNDGTISATDYLLVKKYCLRSASFTAEAIMRSDIDLDGALTSTDLLLIKKACTKG